MLSGFVPFCAFTLREYPAMSKKVTAIEAHAARRAERNKRNFMTPFDGGKVIMGRWCRLTTKIIECQHDLEMRLSS
jgi:hypothetical protein